MKSTDRRAFLGGLSAVALSPMLADIAHAEVSGYGDRFPIWPKDAPGLPTAGVQDQSVRRNADGDPDDLAWPHVATPMLTACPAAQPTGAAVLIIPGGGYTRVAMGTKPSAIARWFAGQGVSAFELLYRLPHDGWKAGPDTPLQDAQRAIRVIRQNARRYDIDPANVAVIGFSAGGHLSGSLATRWNVASYDRVDAADDQDSKPLVASMIFPVVSMQPPVAHGQSRRELLGSSPDEATARKYSLDLDVPADTPPVFLGHAADDKVVDCANSIAMFTACREAHIPAELHIIEEGGHGAPLFEADGRAGLWLNRYARFAARHGLKIPADGP
ncbi:alpha/beta hydrolase [Sphingobium sp. CR2-8]|uniref:alpha/beta hydrolase n=1 Tax=Sphingobium sp. CR2-8 TaxID=1306534 RepID=UPI002DBC8C20|nr:alpha/beta hydrolase [Sphingobium sp. CR2-8]MEC3911859.1 alpha/beta hydrolase [Sphingobium sp. CR2-8]